MKKLSLFFLLISLFITGCREKGHNVPHHSSLTPKPSVKAGHSLKMVYIAGGGKHYMVERWQALGDYLSDKTGINIDVDERKNYRNIIEAFQKKQAHIGSVSGLIYVKLKEELNVVPVVKTVEKGKDVYKSFIVVRKDSGLKNFDDLRGKKFAFVDKQSTSGYLFPRVMMADLGVTKLEDYFSRVVFLDDHLSSIISVYNGYVDGGVVSSFVFESPEAKKYQKDLTVIMETGDIPISCFIVRSDLPQEDINKVKAAFLNIGKSDETIELRKILRVDGYVEAKDSDYDSIRDAMKKLSVLKDKEETPTPVK
ncbi:MAG: phosphate/phosphite/phosphonate ABC transporter substrate-binding protein [Candidatus Eremiobacterota bacterium]